MLTTDPVILCDKLDKTLSAIAYAGFNESAIAEIDGRGGLCENRRAAARAQRSSRPGDKRSACEAKVIAADFQPSRIADLAESESLTRENEIGAARKPIRSLGWKIAEGESGFARIRSRDGV